VWRWVLAVSVACAGCGESVNRQADEIQDPIPDVPLSQQLTIMRRAVDQEWPLTVGKGTLGCDSGAVVFRAGGTTYAVNDTARARGFAPIGPIHAPAPSPPPTNPLKSRTQGERMQIFAELHKCGAVTDCALFVGAKFRLTPAELRLVGSEGNERSWPPLEQQKANLQPLIDRGMKLCRT
jgi:hypothetical protein